MKRTYISPEYIYDKVNGTFNMLEQTSFFGSKMMDIEDSITIDNSDVFYYQKVNSEQLDINKEKILPSIVYSNSDEKKNNHTLNMSLDQSDFEKANNTKWDLRINIKNCLRGYIFSKIKESRAFNGIPSSLTKDGNIDKAIYSYIEYNIINRYEFINIELYLTYNSLNLDGNYQSINPEEINNNTDYQSSNKWDSSIISTTNLEDKVSLDLDFDETYINANFKQKEYRKNYNFNYYFNISYRKK